MRISGFQPFIGHHCETTATGNLLRHAGIELSEPMIFGLGQGLGFILWSSKQMPFPFVGGRRKYDEITKKVALNLGLELDVRTTRSKPKAWRNLLSFLELGRPVALKLDCFHLPYFSTRQHFAAHYVAVHGANEERALVVDTQQQGGCHGVPLDALERARFERGPMASSAMSWTIQPGERLQLETAIRTAIVSNSHEYLNPPIRNFGGAGILKAAEALPSWLERFEDAPAQLRRLASLMERGGTGGGLFRNFYRDFLAEAGEVVCSDRLRDAHEAFREAALLWTETAEAIDRAGQRRSESDLRDASDIMKMIAPLEREAMTSLLSL